MGCGKSTVARFFEEAGFRRMDSDEVVRTRLLPDPVVVAEVARHFGPEVLRADGRLDRGWLAQRIFADDRAREWLEERLHPRLFDIWRQELSEGGEANWVFEVPLLFEKGLENWFDFTLCVFTTVENQFARLEQRGITRAQAESRISKQFSLERKIELADFAIGNDGALEFLHHQVSYLVRMLAVAC